MGKVYDLFTGRCIDQAVTAFAAQGSINYWAHKGWQTRAIVYNRRDTTTSELKDRIDIAFDAFIAKIQGGAR